MVVILYHSKEKVTFMAQLRGIPKYIHAVIWHGLHKSKREETQLYLFFYNLQAIEQKKNKWFVFLNRLQNIEENIKTFSESCMFE